MQEVSMKWFSTCLAATFLSAALLFTSAARAMEIRQFDKMADQDQDEFVGELVVGAQKVLKDEGRPDLAEQVHRLFTTVNPGSDISLGVGEFERNLARLRVEDVDNAQKHPKDPRVEVEDAMAVTLQKNHIELPDSFFIVAENFKPRYPPQDKKK
jgi:hypothetical protein